MKEILARFWFLCKSREAFMITLIIVVSFASFGLGRLSAIQSAEGNTGVKMYFDPNLDNKTAIGAVGESIPLKEVKTLDIESQEVLYVGSKTGTRYHLPWCSGAQRINESNKIFFKSKEEAEAKGYTPAGNCKGI